MRIPGEIKKAVSAWSLGRISSCRYFTRGEVNHNWVVRTESGKYVLRQVLSHDHYRSPKDLAFEFRYLDTLRKGSFPYKVPAALPTISGKLFKEIRGHYYWVYKYIDGEVIEDLDRSHLVQLARMMAEYHLEIERSGFENRIGSSDVFSRGYVLKEMGSFRTEILRRTKRNARDATFLEESAKLIMLLKRLDDSPYRRIKRYHIHRNIIPENLIWKRRELVGLIDFENVSRSREPVVKDVAVTLQFSCRDKKSRRGLDAELARVFLRAYMKRHLLSRNEILLIPGLLVSGLIEDFEYVYWMLRNDPERAKLERLTLYSTAAQWTFANREQLARKLFN